MKNSMMKMIGSVVCAAVVGMALFAYAESEAINPAKVTTPQIVVYGTSNPSTFEKVYVDGTFTGNGAATFSNTVSVAGTATMAAINASGTVAGAGKVTSYGYPAAVSGTNGDAKVYLIQSGKFYALGATTITNTFTVTYKGGTVPDVVACFTPATTNNVITVASNQFTITATESTNGYYIVRGQIQ